MTTTSTTPTTSDRARSPGRPGVSVSVVVTTLNEEESVGWVLANLPAWVDEVVLVDGLSVDGTELVAADVRPDVVVVHQRARGRAAALRAGYLAATTDLVVAVNPNGSTDPRELANVVDRFLGGGGPPTRSRWPAGGGLLKGRVRAGAEILATCGRHPSSLWGRSSSGPSQAAGFGPATSDTLRLIPMLLPAYDSGRWLPAGSDTRSWSELRDGDDLMQVLVAVDGADPRLRRAIALGDLDTLQALAR
ncbi:glycosyltransferase [Conexibacter sp. DBS9H8]|uniref:glycosyltransferase n=1 Tax=Conexibacter sp. DBS9H8 TaxID=2937801 RepID=UPI00200FB61D|nr:glycosyltransferase [Conexibacter sp. DBS9H8]